MGGKGSGRKKVCVSCKEPLICALCGADQNERGSSPMVQVSVHLDRETVEEMKAQAEREGVPFAEVFRQRMGEDED